MPKKLDDKMDELDKEFLEDADIDKEAEIEEEESDEDESEESEESDEESETETESEEEESESEDDDDEDKDEDAADDDEGLPPELVDAKDEDDPLAIFDVVAKSEAAKDPNVKQLLELKDKFVSYGEQLQAKEQAIDDTVNQIEGEFTAFLEPLGLTTDLFKKRNWVEILQQRIKKYFTKTEGEEESEDDDTPLTKKQLREMLQSGNFGKDPRVDKLLETRETSNKQKLYNQAFDYFWNKSPLFKKLSKEDPDFKNNVLDMMGNDYAALLGPDGRAIPLQRRLIEYEKTQQRAIRTAKKAFGFTAPEGKKKQTPLKSGKVPTVSNTKVVKPPKLVKTLKGGKVVRVSREDALEEFDDSFNEGLAD